MKLIIQIPCFNEEKTLPLVFENMPKSIPGIDVLEYQIIDDGCTDKTAEVAKSLGVHHIIKIKGKNKRWLGRAFKVGTEHALSKGADIVVNIDGDNQHPSSKIPELIKPILDGQADIVIGDRNPTQVEDFSPTKRFLQGLGGWAVGFVTKVKVKDAVCGFRAYSRNALEEIHIITNYTYTVDTLVQALKKGLVVNWLEIDAMPQTRESRIIKSLFSKVKKSGSTILRLGVIYKPFKFFLYLAVCFLIPGVFLLLRYLFLYFFIDGTPGHLQSIIIGSVLLIISFGLFSLGVLGDLLSVNRQLLDTSLAKIKKLEGEIEKMQSNRN